MIRPRVIPCLLLSGSGLVKTIKFKKPQYIGDPINTVKLFNDKEVDEVILLDITSKATRKPNYEFLKNIIEEAFMPFCYGGGVNSIEKIQKLFAIGIEKVSINNAALKNINFIEKAASKFGSQSIVATMDVKKDLWGRQYVFANYGKKKTNYKPCDYARQLESMGAGEILVYSIDNDGVMGGYEIELISSVAEAVNIPVIACGGAGKVEDLTVALTEGGVHAVAAGSLFIYKDRNRGVLINYPTENELANIVKIVDCIAN